MSQTSRKSGTRARRSGSAFRAVVVSAIFLALLATASLVGRDFIVRSEPAVVDTTPPAERYRGVVQLAPNGKGKCEQLEFDNATGLMKPKGPAACDEPTDAAPAPVHGTARRLNTISTYFKSH